MSADHRKAARNLREAVLDNSHLSAADLRKKMADEGVNVDRFLKRVDESFRKGFQARAKEQAAQTKARSASARGAVFGNLFGKPREDLLALFRAAKTGQFGGEVMARCRNKNADAMTDDELRSWLEDIEKLNRGN